MAITEVTRPYETLIRHLPDGTVAAHHQQINEVIKDGAVIAATVLQPVTLGTAEANGLGLVDVLGQATVAALVEAEALRAICANQAEQLAQRDAVNAEQAATIATLRVRLTAQSTAAQEA